jgi:hypothetical protein
VPPFVSHDKGARAVSRRRLTLEADEAAFVHQRACTVELSLVDVERRQPLEVRALGCRTLMVDPECVAEDLVCRRTPLFPPN